MSESTNEREQRSLILGTAGHIDHGKSSLIKALTGVDPDRLAEEKKRGITIELGFAQLELPSGRRMGVVDVPGHERFVRHMVAGATGVDVALLVIASDDGIMPQTVEHMAVLELLGVRSCVVALTKTDLVDEEWLEFMSAEIEDKLEDTPFANAPIIPVSSRTGAGLDELRQAVDDVASTAEGVRADGPTRMPVDRVFTVKGFGTVVTGTLWSGIAHEGNELTVLPSEKSTRIRTIQMHGTPASKAHAGNRVAMSLHGLETTDIRPGDFLSSPANAAVADRFDAEFRYADPFDMGKPLASGTRVHIAHGTKEVLGRILFMDGLAELSPKQKTMCQIRLEEPLPVAYQDQFIVRSYSPMHVIGGGTVLVPHPRRRTNLKPGEEDMLEALGKGDAERALEVQLEMAELPRTADEIARDCGLDMRIVVPALEKIEKNASITHIGAESWYARPALLQKAASSIERALFEFHSKNPDLTGISKEALRAQIFPEADTALFDALIAEAESRGAAVHNQGELSHPKAGAGAKMKEAKATESLFEALAKAGESPLDLPDLAKEAGLDDGMAKRAMGNLVRENRAVHVVDERYYDRAVIDRYTQAITDYLDEHGSATAAELKEAMGTSRKYAMPLLEHFDDSGLTVRDGDLRTLRKKS